MKEGVKCLEAEKSIFVSNISFKAPANSAGVCLFECEENEKVTKCLYREPTEQVDVRMLYSGICMNVTVCHRKKKCVCVCVCVC